LLSFIELSRWPSSLVLQGPGLQPALKSVRVSKAMSALQSFVELLKGMDVLLPPFYENSLSELLSAFVITLFRFVYTDTLTYKLLLSIYLYVLMVLGNIVIHAVMISY